MNVNEIAFRIALYDTGYGKEFWVGVESPRSLVAYTTDCCTACFCLEYPRWDLDSAANFMTAR